MFIFAKGVSEITLDFFTAAVQNAAGELITAHIFFKNYSRKLLYSTKKLYKNNLLLTKKRK